MLQEVRALSIRARKAAGAPPLPPGNDRAEVEAMARRLEELRRAAGNSQLRAAYEAAIYGLDAVLYRLAMLRTLESPSLPGARYRPRQRQRPPRPPERPPPGSAQRASNGHEAFFAMVGARKLADLLAEPRATGLARQRRGLSASDASPATAQHVGHVSAAAGGWCTCCWARAGGRSAARPTAGAVGGAIRLTISARSGALGAGAGGDWVAAVGL